MREVVEDMGLEEASLLDTWYRPDHNAIPPVSILQPIDSILGNDEGLSLVFDGYLDLSSRSPPHIYTQKLIATSLLRENGLSANENRITALQVMNSYLIED